MMPGSRENSRPEISAIRERLNQVRSETLRRLEDLTQEQLNARPSQQDGEEAWSLGEVFMHLAIDEIYVRELIARPLLSGVEPPEGVRFLPPPPPRETPKDTIRFWFERARAGTLHYLDNLPAQVDAELTHSGGLEPMNGLEWFLGYAGHEAFHHRQIDALIAANLER